MNHGKSDMYIFLVGINNYLNPAIPNLYGCVNDVDAMEQLLRDKFSIPMGNIKKLTNTQATHRAIKQGFREHLIAHAQAWARAGRQGASPAFLFHYSGHGSQAVDETGREPDGWDETIVPYNSRTTDVYDIKDWELGQLLDELICYSDNVTVILDSCHSGSGTRDIKPGLAAVRRCEPDLRPQPTWCPSSGAPTRSLTGASGWMNAERYTLLAACRDQERAFEYFAREGNRWHGSLTYFLIKALSQMLPDRPLTYRELHERVRYQVNTIYPSQVPQCEGDRDRLVFGGLHPTRDILLTVVDKSADRIWVDGGIAHGLTKGSQLRVCSPGTRTLSQAGPPMAMLYVEEVGAVRSGCRVEEGSLDVPINARAVVYRLNYGDMQRRLALDVPAGPTLNALQDRLAQPDVEPYVKLVAADAPADFRVQMISGLLHIQDGSGTSLVAPYPADELDELIGDLSHLVRYHNALELQNRASQSELAGSVSLSVKQLIFDLQTHQPRAVPIETTAGGEVSIDVGQPIVVEVTNHASLPIYFAMFDFSYDWSITQLYPRTQGAHERLAVGRTYALGLSPKRQDQLAPQLPDEVSEARQIVKVIATVSDADFEIMQQDALKLPYTKRSALTRDDRPVSALSQLLEQAMSGGKRGALVPPPAATEDEWTTAQVEFRITRRADGEQMTRCL